MKPLPFLEAIAFAKTQKVILPDVYYGERIGLARAQARTISNLAGVDQIQAVFDVLDKHLANGGTFKSFRNDIASNKIAVGLPKHRLELVFRNNIQTAYNGGRWQQFQQSKTSHPYLRYSAVNDGRTRPTHRAMHGHIARVDDVWWTTHMPQNGHRCRCTTIALTEKQAKRYGIPSQPPANAQPDQGWDYNAGQAPMAGLKQSAEHKKTTVNKKLVKAVEGAVEEFSLGFNVEFDRFILGINETAKEAIRISPKPIEILKKGYSKGSYYSPSKNKGGGDSGTLVARETDGAMTFLHEYGHHIDHVTAEGYGSGDVVQASLKDSFIKARNDDVDHLKTMFSGGDMFGELSKRWKGRKVMGGVSDIFDSLSKGVFYDKYNMSGHGARYYNVKSGRNKKNNLPKRQAEVFANLFQAYAHDGEAWKEILIFFPNQALAFEKYIKRIIK